MLLTFTESETQNAISINPQNIVSVFTLVKSPSPEMQNFVGKTVIILSNGNVIVDDEYLEVVGRINGEMNNSCCN